MNNQLTQQEIEMANRMAASMLADGVTPEMFMQSMDAFTNNTVKPGHSWRGYKVRTA